MRARVLRNNGDLPEYLFEGKKGMTPGALSGAEEDRERTT